MVNAAGVTFTHDSDRNLLLRQNAVFQNDGTFLLTSPTRGVRGDPASTEPVTFDNTATGLVSAQDSGFKEFTANGTNRFTLNNEGILQVVAQTVNTELDIQNQLTLPQFDGANSLTGGTWRVSADAGVTGRLDLRPAPDNSITTLSGGAEVEFAGTGNVQFPQLALATLDDGTFRVSNGYVHSGNLDANTPLAAAPSAAMAVRSRAT